MLFDFLMVKMNDWYEYIRSYDMLVPVYFNR